MSNLAELARPESDGRISDSEYTRILSDPRFPLAARLLASNMAAVAAADRTTDSVFKDAGRYMVAMAAIYLHATGGLTLPRLKEIGVASGYLSPGRARSLLLVLRHLRWIEPLPSERPAAPVRYAPTAAFLMAWQKHLGAALEAGSIVSPAIAPLLDRLSSPGVLEAFVRHHCTGLLAEARDVEPDWNFTRVFMHPHAGTQIVSALILAGDAAEFPPLGPIPFSIAATSRRFRVSRIHIRRLLDRGAEEGFLRFMSDGAVVLEESTRSAIRIVYAIQFVQMQAAASATLAELPNIS